MNISEKSFIWILDPYPLAELFGKIQAHFGTQVKAAKALSITQGHFSKLTKPDQIAARISGKLFRRLRQLVLQRSVPDHWWSLLMRTVMVGDALEALGTHWDWLRVGLFPYTPKETLYSTRPGDPLDMVDVRWRYEYRASLLKGLQESESELRRCSNGVYGDRLDRFREAMRERGHRDNRIDLALWHVVGPLLAYLETEHVERGWGELDKNGELEAYLDSALRCQSILLDRPPDVQRAQEMAGALVRPTKPRRTKKRR